MLETTVPAADRFYITTAIPYVNSKPHIGFALEIVQTDAFARYHRLRGDDTYFLTGTDDNSLTNVLAAEQEGIPTQELVNRNAQLFDALRLHLDLSFDQFIRTSVDERHAAGAQKLWQAVADAGDIYKQHYSGLYCVRCEQYYAESELIDGLCPEHQIPPELIEEENYFFRLSRYGDRLYNLISSDRYRVIPDSRKNEVLSFIARGLQDFSISRSQARARGWGIPVPDDPEQVMYVWFDALTNYITALDYAADGEVYRRYWAENSHRVHVIGKGIIRFHAIYWPAMLLSAGVPLPETLFVHGYITVGGTKMSKSLGNVVDPVELVKQYGMEAVRYYMLRAISPTGDANFTLENFEARYNADLANDLGNLVNRSASMIARYRDGIVPVPGDSDSLDSHVRELAHGAHETLVHAMDNFDPQSALNAVWDLVTRANKYAEESAPWALAKSARAGDAAAEARLDTSLYTLSESVRLIGAMLEPFLPETARRIRRQLGLPEDDGTEWRARLRWGGLAPGTRVERASPLFPRLEADVRETVSGHTP
ncbi:MAG: methionine--tRNA ligase [Chloroflexota bacterium]